MFQPREYFKIFRGLIRQGRLVEHNCVAGLNPGSTQLVDLVDEIVRPTLRDAHCAEQFGFAYIFFCVII